MDTPSSRSTWTSCTPSLLFLLSLPLAGVCMRTHIGPTVTRVPATYKGLSIVGSQHLTGAASASSPCSIALTKTLPSGFPQDEPVRLSWRWCPELAVSAVIYTKAIHLGPRNNLRAGCRGGKADRSSIVVHDQCASRTPHNDRMGQLTVWHKTVIFLLEDFISWSTNKLISKTKRSVRLFTCNTNRCTLGEKYQNDWLII